MLNSCSVSDPSPLVLIRIGFFSKSGWQKIRVRIHVKASKTVTTSEIKKVNLNYRMLAPGFRSRDIRLEPELSLWPGSTLNICLIIHENYMELNII